MKGLWESRAPRAKNLGFVFGNTGLGGEAGWQIRARSTTRRRSIARVLETTATSFPILLSLRVAGLALLFVSPVALAIAFVQARLRYALRGLVDALVLLPLVLPPSVVGYFLVVLFGRRSALGRALEDEIGLRLVFSPWGAVLASAVVALPILVKTAQPSIEAVPRNLEDVARSLGLGPIEVVFRVTFPLAYRGVLAALVLGFARAIGEFGATLMLAGNIPGRTNTMPLEIFAAFQEGDDARAGLYVAVLSVFSLAVVVIAGLFGPKETRS